MKRILIFPICLFLWCTVLKAQTVEFNYNATATIAAGSGGAQSGAGNAGVIFFNNQFWVSEWASADVHLLDNTGNYISTFQIPGISGIRSMTTDGTSIYCGTAGLQIFRVDPVSKTLLSTINVTTATTARARVCTYDASLNGGMGGFWLANFGTDIISVDMNGNQLSVIPAATHGFTAMYGGAVDGLGNLYLYTQQGPNTDQISILNLGTQTVTGTPYDVFVNATSVHSASSLAGGMSFSDDVVPGKKIAVGLAQGTPNNVLFGIDFNIQSGTGFDCITNTTATPDAPTLALNSANPTGAIDASWPAAASPMYTVRWRPQGASGYAQRTISTNNYASSQLMPATLYDFLVVNRCTINPADFYTSSIASLATASPSAGCGAPAIACGATSPTSVTFEWPELTAATRVGIRFSFAGQAGYSQRSSIAYTTSSGTSSFTLSGLQSNQVYTITAFAECDGRIWWGSPITCSTGIAASRLSNETYNFSYEGAEYVNVKMTDFQFFEPAAGLPNHTVDVSSGQLVVSFEEASQKAFSFGLLPNVTSDMTSLSFVTEKATDANLSIYSLNGTLVYQQALGQVQNAQRVELNTTEFAAGVYQVVVQTNDTQYSQKLVVVK